jgi:hypothetical protein
MQKPTRRWAFCLYFYKSTIEQIAIIVAIPAMAPDTAMLAIFPVVKVIFLMGVF